jgi:hypothetical protein
MCDGRWEIRIQGVLRQECGMVGTMDMPEVAEREKK